MKNTLPRLLAAAAACAAATAQDIILPLGFGSSGGPPATSYPVARAKDKNGDGFADASETVAFVTQMPSQAASGTHFMTDGRMVVENGEPAFYFTHFWGKGSPDKLAKGIKAALDVQAKVRGPMPMKG